MVWLQGRRRAVKMLVLVLVLGMAMRLNVAGDAAQRRQDAVVAVMAHQRRKPVGLGRARKLAMAVHRRWRRRKRRLVVMLDLRVVGRELRQWPRRQHSQGRAGTGIRWSVAMVKGKGVDVRESRLRLRSRRQRRRQRQRGSEGGRTGRSWVWIVAGRLAMHVIAVHVCGRERKNG